MFIICMVQNQRVQACIATSDEIDAVFKFESMLHGFLPPEVVRNVMNRKNPEMYGPEVVYHDEERNMTFQIKRI